MNTPRRSPQHSKDEQSELAALYALGALDADEHERCERLWRADADFRAEVESHRPALHALAEGAAEVAPPPALWSKVLARVRQASAPARGSAANGAVESGTDAGAQPWKSWASSSAGPLSFVARESSRFEPTAVPGVSVRRLAVDRAQDRVTMLVRMEPGAAYPVHRHGGPEECLVLEGDLEVGDQLRMQAGDFQRAEAGSVHAVQRTRGGCVLYITSSLRDELVAA
jgi:putative transcriptional regulator